MSILATLLFIFLQILFIPFAVIGIAIVAYKQLVISKKLGISQTAIEVINARWTMHVFGLREDHNSVAIASVLPNDSVVGLWLTLFPLWLRYRLTGKQFLYPRIPEPGTENYGDMMIVRTQYFDKMIEDEIGEVEQFVILGAGYDTRCFNYPDYSDVCFYELDQPEVQKHKREALSAAGIASDHVRFVSVDFAGDDIFEKLKHAGYDPSKKTLFLWEGVTLYLTEDAVRQAMLDIRSNASPGSILLTDFYADRMVKMGKSNVGQKVLDYTNEGFGFSFDFSSHAQEALKEFVNSTSMSLNDNYFLGQKSPKGPYMVVAKVCVTAS